MSGKNYLAEIEREFPGLKPGEEDDDRWENEGFGFLRSKNYAAAEVKFKMLTMSQPRHHGGFEGLAYLYHDTGEHDKAVWFMTRAVQIARRFLEDDSIDMKVIDEMEENLKAIETKGALRKWWE